MRTNAQWTEFWDYVCKHGEASYEPDWVERAITQASMSYVVRKTEKKLNQSWRIK